MDLRIDPEVPRDVDRRGLSTIDVLTPNAEAAPVPIAGSAEARLDRRSIRAGVIDVAGCCHVMAVALCSRGQLWTDRQRQQAALRAQCIDARQQISRGIGLRADRLDERHRQRDQDQNAECRMWNAE